METGKSLDSKSARGDIIEAEMRRKISSHIASRGGGNLLTHGAAALQQQPARDEIGHAGRRTGSDLGVGIFIAPADVAGPAGQARDQLVILVA